MSAGQDNKVLYFGDYIPLPVYTEADFQRWEKESKEKPYTFDGIMTGFSFHLAHVVKIDFEFNDKNPKKIKVKGDVNKIHDIFMARYNKHTSLVNITKKKKYLLFEAS